jgi:hypothetical protein
MLGSSENYLLPELNENSIPQIRNTLFSMPQLFIEDCADFEKTVVRS